MVAWRYEIYLLVFKSISHSFAPLTRTFEEKFHISAHHVLYFIYFQVVLCVLSLQEPITLCGQVFPLQ